MAAPHIVVIDGHNFMHRARSGFTKGKYAVVFNFMRNLRALVELHNPSRLYFVLEGRPRARYELMEGYKANRVIDPEGDPKAFQAMVDFHRQVRIIVGLMKEYLPIAVVRHPDHECDDTIFNLINRSCRAIPWTVVSNDTDFIQLLQRFDNVEVWNPMRKEHVTAPEYNYVMWKALRGDGSDCIPGIPGVGDKTAERLVNDEDALRTFLAESPEREATFIRNVELIRFAEWDHEEHLQMQCWQAQRPQDRLLRMGFDTMGFKSITNDTYWKRFTGTFAPLWGDNK